MVSSTILTLCVIPALYALVKQWELGRAKHDVAPVTADLPDARPLVEIT
jgi:Cu(I)/Ag(I) efflux system membrane protein CusA/SilA